MTKIRGILIAGILILTAFVLSGCGSIAIEAFAKTDLVNIMTDRINANKEIASRLHNSGLISEEERDSIIKSIDSQMGAYLDGSVTTNSKLQQRLFDAIVDWNAPNWVSSKTENGVEKNSYGYTEEEWFNDVVTSYIAYTKGVSDKVDIRLLKGKNSNIVPISIIDGKTGDDINKRLAYKVYVLKPFAKTTSDTTISSQTSLDELISLVRQATIDRKKINNNDLDRFFMPAKNEKGEHVTLLDISKWENQVVADSRGSSLVSNTKYGYDSSGKLEVVEEGNKVTKGVSVKNTGFNTTGNGKTPGNDMIVTGANGRVNMMSIRFHEFNEVAVNNIIETLGMNPDQYLFTTSGSDNRVYIMEYPIHYVSEIKNKDGDSTKFECKFAPSDIGINLMTGKLIKYGLAWGDPSAPGVYFEDSDPYLSVAGSRGPSEEGKSAFVIEGETPDDALIEIGGNKDKVKTGRIVLRDYLEATYAPGVVSGEDLVVFGRKLRLLEFEGNKSDVVAKYYDKEGNPLDIGKGLYIYDFADLEALAVEDEPEIRYLGREGEATGQVTNPVSGDNALGSGLGTSLRKVENLKQVVSDSIYPTDKFPGPLIGTIDYGEHSKPLFYAMVVKRNLFDTALFSGWINAEDTDENSLHWWIRWLADPARNYSYTINTTTLEEFLAGNYSFELRESGIIILDLETINKIQKEYEQQDRENTSKWFRTTFVVIGWAIICYAFVLLIAWAVDTNVDLGLNILEKMTLGHWVAIKHPEELPYADLGERKYIGFQELLLKTLGMAVVGVLLILVNVVDVVVGLVDIFGDIAKMIGRLISGV